MSLNNNLDSIQRAILIILDGYGVNDEADNNAVTQAHTPRLDEYFYKYP